MSSLGYASKKSSLPGVVREPYGRLPTYKLYPLANPKGPSIVIVHTWTPKSGYRNPSQAQVYAIQLHGLIGKGL